MRSACRGVARNGPEPKRSRSYFDAPAAIISIAQQARPNVMGHTLAARAQFTKWSTVVSMTLYLRNSSSGRFAWGPAWPGWIWTSSAMDLSLLGRHELVGRLDPREVAL